MENSRPLLHIDTRYGAPDVRDENGLQATREELLALYLELRDAAEAVLVGRENFITGDQFIHALRETVDAVRPEED